MTHACNCGDCAVAPFDDRCRFEIRLAEAAEAIRANHLLMVERTTELEEAKEVIHDLLPAWLNQWQPAQDIIDRAEAVLGDA